MKAHVYKRYLVFVLSAVAALNFADRLALGLVLQNIKVELHLTDAQVGLLTGIACAFFYSIMGVPIARWVDRGNRVSVISVTAAVWTVMVILTGRATTFAQLMLARIGVGIGDAGIGPAAQSLIPEYFTRAERPRATAIYLMGLPASMVLGYFVAGWVDEFYGTRVMFLYLGLAGLLATLVARFTLREPRLDNVAKEAAANLVARDVAYPSTLRAASESSSYLSVKAVLSALFANVTFRHLLVCNSVTALFSVGIFQWMPTFFIRSYGMTIAQVGTWFTITIGLCGLLTTYWGGALMSRYAANNEGLQFKVMAAGFVALGVDHALIFLSPNRYLALALLGVGTLSGAASGPTLAAIQTIVPPRMRAMSVVIVGLFASLIGAGLGPVLAGALSDALRNMFGQDSLRFALLSLCPGYAWGAWHMWRASRTVSADLEKLQRSSDEAGACVWQA